MKWILVYAIESSICLALLWLIYALFLKRDTFHRQNRLYLLFSLVFSSVIPALEFNLPWSVVSGIHQDITKIILPEVVITASRGPVTAANLISGLLPGIYTAGMVLTGLVFIAGSYRILHVISRKPDSGRIIRHDKDARLCYSAFGHIFISRNFSGEETERIVAHEQNHLRNLHHIDLVIVAIVSIVQWFNPAVYFTRRSLQAIHEYEADDECLKNGETVSSYSDLLVSSSLGVRIAFLTNTFSENSLLKNRIIMMTKRKTRRYASLKLMIALPMAVLMFLLFSCRDVGNNKSGSALPATEARQGSEASEQPVAESAGNKDESAISAKSDDEVYKTAEEMPSFPGGFDALTKFMVDNLEYPDQAKKDGIQGKVVISFTVDETGSVTNVKVAQSVHPLLDKAACELIMKSPKWNPGKEKGDPVKVLYSLPVSFRLQ